MGRIDYETETMIVQGYDILGVPATRGAVETCTHTPLRARTPGQSEASTTTVIVCATGDVTHTLKAEGFDASEDGTGRGTPIIAFNSNAQPDEMRFDPHMSAPLTCSQNSAVLAYAVQAGALRTNPTSGPDGLGVQANIAYTLEARAEVQAVVQPDAPLYYSHDYSHQRVYGVHAPTEALTVARKPNFLVGARVRRLTPLECERLQAFPDRYTAIPKAKDGPRYKALGNSMCVNVMRWIRHQVDSAVRFW